jgi:hypothetical protein
MKYFLIYDDETNAYKQNIDRLIHSVEQYSDFNIILFKKGDIDPTFLEKNKKILNCKRGGGYWLWKPYIINTVLSKINTDDILFYLDSSYYFIRKFTDLYKDKELVVFSNKPNEGTNKFKYLCKMDVILKYNMQDIDINECWAGAICLKKTEFTSTFIKTWLDMCCIYEDITDEPSKTHNPFFVDHRHDQSLLTILITKHNITPIFLTKYYLQNVRQPF